MEASFQKWKWIKGFRGKYKVSRAGKIKSVSRIIYSGHKGSKPRTCPARMLKTSVNHKGYRVLCLCKNGVQKTYILHRIVAQTFIPNPYNKPEVNHKDGNKLNNHWTNLEWVTDQEQAAHAHRMGLAKSVTGEQQGNAKLSNDKVLFIRAMLRLGIFNGVELAKMHQVDTTLVSMIKLRKVWRHI